jgi:hypothetical protein
MAPRTVSAFFLSVAIGYGLGFIPVVNQHLHWNVWFVVPIGGLFLGAGLGWIQFWTHSLLRLRITRATTAAIVAGSCACYVATEYGVYRSTIVTVVDESTGEEHERRLDELMSLGTYLRVRLGSSTVAVGHTSKVELGFVVTTASFVVDLLGAGLGTLGMVATLGFMHPLCRRCSRLKKKVRSYGILPPSRKESVQELLRQLATLCGGGRHAEFVALLHALAKGEQNQKSSLQIAVRELACPSCSEATVLVRVFKKDENGKWVEDGEVKLSSTEAAAAPAVQEA